MSIRKTLLLSAALAFGGLTAPAIAQDAAAPAAVPQITAGMAVKDPQGGAIGTIESVDGANVVLKTDRHQVRLPNNAFAAADGGLVMGMTLAEVNAAVDQSMAQAANAVAVGATVYGSGGGTVGTVTEKDDQFATVKLASGTLVKLPVSAFGPGQNGPMIGMTAAQLEAQVASSAPAPAAAPEAETEGE
ncbi:hypothetical protein [Allosphingosinicella indica]|uniref:PRC-barrel domain-containing protein n=1 Tax=Allosphingosinicella indica TaxID=941907 RepID=A0A1X7GTA8_9SPHN|nr:hypothetical protein [Allosphingosinicella indica]SMF73672.1 hypothetical protein SAMN06295910_2162 [Allosphingosinicella indica]